MRASFSGPPVKPSLLSMSMPQLSGYVLKPAAGFFGGFLGLILGGKLILLSLRSRQRDYEADRAGCVSCGRCFKYCPKEQEYRLQKIQETGGVSG